MFKLGDGKFNKEEFLKHYALKDKDGNPIQMVPDMKKSIKENTKKMDDLYKKYPERDRNYNMPKKKENNKIEAKSESIDTSKINFNAYEDEVSDALTLQALKDI